MGFARQYSLMNAFIAVIVVFGLLGMGRAVYRAVMGAPRGLNARIIGIRIDPQTALRRDSVAPEPGPEPYPYGPYIGIRL
jgi:hypothetical protein